MKLKCVKLLLVGFILSIGSSLYSAGLLVAEGGFGGQLTIKEQKVKVRINNGIAVTEVDQTFVNQENRQVEALYTFPVPKGASVAEFSMWINGKEMIGEVVEKERARKIYNTYKAQRVDPGLLEQVDYRKFEMRIFPINARAEQRVRIVYYQELDFDHDWATYVYPLSSSTISKAVNERVEGTFSLSLDVLSEVPISKLESPSHGADFAVAKQTAKLYHASMELESGDLSKDIVLAYKTERAQTGIDMICSRMSGSEDGYFYMTLTVGKELEAKQIPMDYVFVLDISGSMRSDGKITTSKNSIAAFARTLGSEDRMEVITFNVSANHLFKKMEPANEENIQKAVRFIGSRAPRGGTFLAPALQSAYKYKQADRILNVIVLSDGLTEQRERDQLTHLISNRPAQSRVFCIGVGNDVNRPLLKSIAEGSGGLAAFVSKADNLDRQAKAFQRKLKHPVFTDIKINFDGAGVYDIVPQKIPNLYHGMPIRIYGRYKTPGSINFTLTGDIAGEIKTQAMPMTFPETANANPEIERMWAWHRIQSLNNAPASRNEIVRLGELYSIVTPHTSLLVLENDDEYKRWNIERRNVLRVGNERQAREQLLAKLDKLRQESNAGNFNPARQPTNTAQRTANPNNPRPTNSPSPRNSNSHNVPLIGGGGGAINPLVALIMLIPGIAFFVLRRKR